MHSQYIPSDEIVFQGLSFTDSDRLFKWNGALFRGISSDRASFCRDLFDRGIMQDLIAKKLFVETEITPLKMDHYEIVLKHRTVPFVSYPQEWCDLMLKDAALHQLDFCLELNEHNLESEDAHPLNILFDGPQPLFVDFGSIAPLPVDPSRLPWLPYEQFCRAFIRPLRLMAHGHDRIAHWLLHDYELGILQSDVEALIHHPFLCWSPVRKTFHRYRSPTSSHLPSLSPRAFLKKTYRDVESIRLPPVPSDRPNADTASLSLPPSPPSEYRARCRAAFSSLLSELRPASVLNIIGRQDDAVDFSVQAARYGSQVVAVHPYEINVRNLYIISKQNSLPILPLQIDLFSPSHDLSNYWFKPAAERLCCDLVLAMNLIDQLVEENLPLDLIVKRFSTLSRRWLLADLSHLNDRLNGNLNTPHASSYTIDHLMNQLKICFHKVDILSPGVENRLLLLCEKESHCE